MFVHGGGGGKSLPKWSPRDHDNTYKDFTYNDFTYKVFTYNINKYDITYMFYLFTVISKVKYK